MMSSIGANRSSSASRFSREMYRSNFDEVSFVISSRTVAVVATSWAVVTARSSAFAGVDVVESRPLIRTLVSTTTRSRAIVLQQLGETFLGETLAPRLCGDFFPKIQERLNVASSEPLVVGH